MDPVAKSIIFLGLTTCVLWKLFLSNLDSNLDALVDYAFIFFTIWTMHQLFRGLTPVANNPKDALKKKD